MTRFAILIAGAVQNVAVASPEYGAAKGWVASDSAAIGDHYDEATGTFAPPVPTTDQLEALREQARARVNTWRDEQEAAGIVFEHAGRSWDGGLVVRTRLAGLQSLQALPDGFFWTDAEDVDVPMTLAALAALHAAHEAAIVARGFEIHVRQRELKADIEGMSFEQLQAFAPDRPRPDTQAPDSPAA